MKKYFIFALSLVALLGCMDPNWEQIVMIIGISDEHNGQRGKIRTGKDMKIVADERRGNPVVSYVSNGRLEIPLFEATGEKYPSEWYGNGNFPVIMLLDDETFVYTEGKTFEELQIDICTITGINEFDMQLEDFNKLPKVKFPDPKHSGKVGATIEFNQFQKVVCD